MISVLWPLFVLTIISAAVTAAVVFFGNRFLPVHGLADSEEKKAGNFPEPVQAAERLKEPARAISLKPLLGGVWWMMFELVLIFFFPWAVAMGNGALGGGSLWCAGLLMGVLLAGALYIRGRGGFVGEESIPPE